jgi:hypothetical protein
MCKNVSHWKKIINSADFYSFLLSLPAWERGLKFSNSFFVPPIFVAPCMGAWIEIVSSSDICNSLPSRSLHGSVD